jgi:hypothetical protein
MADFPWIAVNGPPPRELVHEADWDQNALLLH